MLIQSEPNKTTTKSNFLHAFSSFMSLLTRFKLSARIITMTIMKLLIHFLSLSLFEFDVSRANPRPINIVFPALSSPGVISRTDDDGKIIKIHGCMIVCLRWSLSLSLPTTSSGSSIQKASTQKILLFLHVNNMENAEGEGEQRRQSTRETRTSLYIINHFELKYMLSSSQVHYSYF